MEQTPSLAKQLWHFLYLRLVVSKWPTIAGFVLGGLVEGFNLYVLPLLGQSTNPTVHAIAAAIVLYGAGKLSPKAVEAYFAKKQAELDAKTATPPAAAGFSRFWLIYTLAVAAILVAVAAPHFARAQDAQPASAAPDTTQPGYQAPEPPVITIPQLPKVSLDLGGGWSLQGGAGVGGSALAQVKQDDGSLKWQLVRNVQLAGLLEIGTPWSFADPVLGPAWQTGTAQGWGATFGGVEKKTGTNLTALASPIWVGGKATWSFVFGTMVRY